MELVLKKDVEGLGRAGEIVDVADGYARNYLLPRRMAAGVTPQALKEAERLRKIREAEEAEERAARQQLLDRLHGFSCVLTAKANEAGHLFGSIGPVQVAESITLLGIPVADRQVLLEEHIREIGEYDVRVRLGPEQETDVRVVVMREEDAAEEGVSQEQSPQAIEDAEEGSERDAGDLPAS